MKTNYKKLTLINHGLSSSLINSLNENQVNALYKRLSEAKKEPKEATTKTETKTYTDYSSGEVNNMKSKGQTINVKDGQVQPLPDGGIRVVQEDDDLENDDISLSLGAEGDNDMALALSNMDLTEKFESKAQQKYFWAKCNRSKGKEKEKWCKMADEFQKSTSKKQSENMPEKKHPEKTVKYPKKKETKESYLDMIGKATNKNMQNKIADIRPGLKFESKIEKKILSMVDKHIYPSMTKKDFLNLIENFNISEQGEVETPVKPDIKPGVKPDVNPKEPTPSTPYQPKHKPAPKAKEKEIETPVKPGVKPERPTPSTPYQPKHKPAPKAEKKELPNWLSFNSIGIKFLGK